MSRLTYGNEADKLLMALTAEPSPDVQDWEVLESSYDDEGASALVQINGRNFHVRITPFGCDA